MFSLSNVKEGHVFHTLTCSGKLASSSPQFLSERGQATDREWRGNLAIVDPFQMERFPWLDNFCLDVGPYILLASLCVMALALRHRPDPIVAILFVALPGFLLQQVVMASGLVRTIELLRLAPSLSLLDFSLSAGVLALSLIFLRSGYLFIWIPFFVFIYLSWLVLRQRSSGFSRQPGTALSAAVLALILTSYLATHDRLDFMRQVVSAKGV